MSFITLNVSLNDKPAQATLNTVLATPHFTKGSKLHFEMSRCLDRDLEDDPEDLDVPMIFKGCLYVTADEKTVSHDAIVKLAEVDDPESSQLKHEADMYTTRLQGLQGTIVPKFYGYYTGSLDVERPNMACIVLEYCGSTPEGFIDEWDKETKTRIIRHMVKVHEAGVEHGSFDERSVVQSEASSDEWRIIGFSHARPHVCGRKMPVELYQWIPSAVDFGCFELFSVVDSTDLWTPDTIPFPGAAPFSIFDAPSVKRLFRYARRWRPNVPEKRLHEMCKIILGNYYARYDDRWKYIGHPMEYRTPFLNRKNQPMDDSDNDSTGN